MLMRLKQAIQPHRRLRYHRRFRRPAPASLPVEACFLQPGENPVAVARDPSAGCSFSRPPPVGCFAYVFRCDEPADRLNAAP